MLGLIITGHGHFATGLSSSLKLITGGREDLGIIDFEENDTIEMLKDKLEAAISALSSCDGILILCDLAGGSPFKTSVEIAAESEKEIKVIGGSSLPMLIETAMSLDFEDSLDSLVELALSTGKESIVEFKLAAHTDNTEDGEGI